MRDHKPFTIDGVSRFLGFRYESPGRLRLTVRPELLNPPGLLSGVVAVGTFAIFPRRPPA